MNSANIPLYHIFLTVARSSSISGAAKSLYISQPAVSKSISGIYMYPMCHMDCFDIKIVPVYKKTGMIDTRLSFTG